ncbi:hypothetical protein SRABI04_01719 [Chryseobacterium sp. Bi04]|nr:hypothetical protein SRABI04_01719 [Chryseobacterium sp. Bi04]
MTDCVVLFKKLKTNQKTNYIMKNEQNYAVPILTDTSKIIVSSKLKQH